jgi:hypothetical protein
LNYIDPKSIERCSKLGTHDKQDSFTEPANITLSDEEKKFIAKRREQRKALVHVIDVRAIILDTCMYKDSYVDKKTGQTVTANKMSVDSFIALMNQCGSEDEYVFMKSGWQNGGAVKVAKRA